MAMLCEHLFTRNGKRKVEGYWLRKPWWRCVRCRFETRTYDSIDRMAMRPIHSHMTVAMVGFNATEDKEVESQND